MSKKTTKKSVPVKKTEHPVLDLTKALAIQTQTGELKLFKSKVPLSIKAGTLVKPAGMNVVLCSGEGYKLQAQRGGIMPILAKTVIVDGQEQSNPHVFRDDRGHIKMVYARAYAFGYTPMGIPVVTDRTVIFDVTVYEQVDLIAKAKRNPEDFKIKPKDTKPAQGWAVYYIDEGVELQVNTESPEFTQWMSNILNRKRKAVEIAQTFAVRNAIKAHPNIQFHKMDEGYSTVVDVLCWRAVKGEMRWDMSAFNANMDDIEAMAGGEVSSQQEGQQVKVDQATERLDTEDATIDIEAEEQVAPDEGDAQANQQEDLFNKEERPKESKEDLRKRLIEEVESIENDHQGAMAKAWKTLGIDPDLLLSQLGDSPLSKLHNEMINSLD